MATIYTKIVNRKLSISEKLLFKVGQFFTTFFRLSQLCLKIGLSSQRPKCRANLGQIMTSNIPGPYLDIGGPYGPFKSGFQKSPKIASFHQDLCSNIPKSPPRGLQAADINLKGSDGSYSGALAKI